MIAEADEHSFSCDGNATEITPPEVCMRNMRRMLIFICGKFFGKEFISVLKIAQQNVYVDSHIVYTCLEEFNANNAFLRNSVVSLPPFKVVAVGRGVPNTFLL